MVRHSICGYPVSTSHSKHYYSSPCLIRPPYCQEILATLERWPLARDKTNCLYSKSDIDFFVILQKLSWSRLSGHRREGPLYSLQRFQNYRIDLLLFGVYWQRVHVLGAGVPYKETPFPALCLQNFLALAASRVGVIPAVNKYTSILTWLIPLLIILIMYQYIVQ